MWKPVLVVAALATTAHAGPTSRFGLTGAIADQSAPGQFQLGPQLSLGERIGPFVAELDYAYLSFFNESVVHRLGVTGRVDLYRTYEASCYLGYSCTRGTSFFGEAGVGERLGQWIVDDTQRLPANTSHVPEAHIGFGYELENELTPLRNGWQFAVRFAVSPRDPQLGSACRGTTCGSATMAGSSSGLDSSVFVEWMFVLGR